MSILSSHYLDYKQSEFNANDYTLYMYLSIK